MSANLPFKNIIVIDFTHVLAGPACSYYLSLLGAEVIKVESVDKGDAIRHRGGTDAEAAKNGMSTSYITQAAGKKSITLDLETDEGFRVFHQLCSVADILVENHIPSRMRHLKLDETSIRDRHPHLIYCALTGYGRGGPQENTAAYDVNIQAACGLMEATGTAESGPIRTGAPILDYSTALSASFAISAALYQRQNTGTGCFIDVSMLETGLSLMSSTITDYYATGNAPMRRGNLANSRSPGAGSFPCKEGILSLGVNEEAHFHALARAFGKDSWLVDQRYQQREARKIHASELALEIETILSQKTADEWEAILQTAGVPCAKLRSLPEALASDQVKARGFIQTLADGARVPTLPFRIGGEHSYAPDGIPPKLGADNAWLQTWLAQKLQEQS